MLLKKKISSATLRFTTLRLSFHQGEKNFHLSKTDHSVTSKFLQCYFKDLLETNLATFFQALLASGDRKLRSEGGTPFATDHS